MKKTKCITIGVTLLIIMLIGLGFWVFSDKTIIKKEKQKGVLIDRETWEVVDQVEVEFDGKITFDSKISKTMKLYSGSIHISCLNGKRKKQEFRDSVIQLVPLFDSNAVQRMGVIAGSRKGKREHSGVLYTYGVDTETFMIRYMNNDEENLYVMVPASTLEDAKAIYNKFNKD